MIMKNKINLKWYKSHRKEDDEKLHQSEQLRLQLLQELRDGDTSPIPVSEYNEIYYYLQMLDDQRQVRILNKKNLQLKLDMKVQKKKIKVQKKKIKELEKKMRN